MVLVGVRAPLRLHKASKRQSVVGLEEREVYEITALQSVVRGLGSPPAMWRTHACVGVQSCAQ